MVPDIPESEPVSPAEDKNNNTGSTPDVRTKSILKPEAAKKTKTKERVFPEVVLDVVLEVAQPETHNSIQEFFQKAFSPSNHTRLRFS